MPPSTRSLDTGSLLTPPAPPDPSRNRASAAGALVDAFYKTLGLEAAAQAASQERSRADHYARYAQDPAAWAGEVAKSHLWSRQRTILESIRDHRLTAVPSCHGIGKDFTAAHACAWWIDAHPPGEALVVLTANTESQLEAVVWKEIGRVHAQAKLAGRMTHLRWKMVMPAGNEEIVGIGLRPADDNPSAFQGLHQRYILIVLDEAAEIPAPIWDAAYSLISNVNARFLAIGNPTVGNCEFERICRPGSGWNVLTTPVWDTPNFPNHPRRTIPPETVPPLVAENLVSPEWVEMTARKYGVTNPQYLSRVEAVFPVTAEGGLIPSDWVLAAQRYDMNEKAKEIALPNYPIELGVDVGGGGDKTVIALRKGGQVRIVHRGSNPNTMESLSKVLELIRETGATSTKIDEIGIGKGMVDRAKELASDQTRSKLDRDRARSIIGVNVGKSPNDRESYANLRAESYWELRERFQATAAGNFADGIDIDPTDDELAAQLVDLSFKSVAGRTQIESKLEMKRRGKNSPDAADAVMLAFTGGKKGKRGGTWGRRDRGLRRGY